MNNKILMIVNAFPPSGESGVQRPVKFLKYLAKDGWDTFVVTPRNPVLLKNKDDTLVSEIPSSTKVFKTYSLGIREENLTEVRFALAESAKPLKKLLWKMLKPVNDFVFPIDKQIGWVPFALITAIRVIKKYKIRNLYITGSPFSAFLCGVILKKLFGMKLFWIADYRDAWQFTPLLDKLVLPFRYNFITKMDEKFLNMADFVTFTSPYVLKKYLEKYPRLLGKSDFITNGYDEDDFARLESRQYNMFTFAFMGKLHSSRGNPVPWLKVIKRFMNKEFQYMHMGIIDKNFLRQITEEGLSFYHFIGYKSHLEALSYSAGADINIIVLNDDPGSVGVIPGKIFELIRLGKPILAIGPANSVIKEIITSTNAGVYANVNDQDSIVKALEMLVNQDFRITANKDIIEQYSRRICTEKLESIYLRNLRT